jgi:hypothetical protein
VDLQLLLLLLLYLLGILKVVGLTWKRDFLYLPRIPRRRRRRRRWKEIILPYISYSKFGGEMS